MKNKNIKLKKNSESGKEEIRKGERKRGRETKAIEAKKKREKGRWKKEKKSRKNGEVMGCELAMEDNFPRSQK